MKLLYEILWIITGLLLGILVAGIVVLVCDAVLAFLLLFYIPLAIAGAIFGWWVGPIAWRKVYVEGFRGKKYIIKSK